MKLNPWGFLVLLAGLVLVIVGVKGTQHNITSAITGVPHGGSSYPGHTPVQSNPNGGKWWVTASGIVQSQTKPSGSNVQGPFNTSAAAQDWINTHVVQGPPLI